MVNRYYVIEIPTDSSEYIYETENTIDQYCEIIPVDIYPAYSSLKVALRSDDYEIIYYSFHQWAVRPSESFTRIMEDYFLHHKVFKGVSTRFWRINPKYKLITSIYRLEVLEEQGQLNAHLSLEFRLVEGENNLLLLSHKVNRKELLNSKDLNLFARAVGEIFYDELNRFSGKIMSEIPQENE
jgi:ABC-type uncharacterized transport system auxiliary subunit